MASAATSDHHTVRGGATDPPAPRPAARLVGAESNAERISPTAAAALVDDGDGPVALLPFDWQPTLAPTEFPLLVFSDAGAGSKDIKNPTSPFRAGRAGVRLDEG